MSLNITRIGPDPATELPRLVSTGIWQEVVYHQDRLTRDAQGKGDLPTDPKRIERRMVKGGSSQLVPDWLAVIDPPLPDYKTITRGANTAPEMADAAAFVATRYAREAPSTNEAKNHPYRLRSSVAIFLNGKRVYSPPDGRKLAPGDSIAITIIAPHASTVESTAHVLAHVCRAAQNLWPHLSISFGWIDSKTVGQRFGRTTGGPKEGDYFALPTVTIHASGRSVIGLAKDRKGD